MPHTKFFAAFWVLTTPYWRSRERAKGVGLLVACVGLTLGLVYVNVLLNVWHNEFFNAIQDKRLDAFYRLLGRFSLLALAFIVMEVYRLYLTQMLQIEWRTWLTDRYLERWLADRAYYRLQLLDHGTDNPDQRIADDLKLFVDSTLSLGLGLLSAVVTLVSFLGILWMLSGTLTLPLGDGTIAIPGYLVWFALLYAAAGSGLAHWIGRRLIGLEYHQQRVEADFRFSLMRLRENSEGVAMYRGEPEELTGFRARFAHVIGNWWAIMRTRKQLTWFTAGYGQFAVIFPYVVVAPRYFSGAMPLGGLMQTGLAFGEVHRALSWFVQAYVELAVWTATVERLIGFTQALARTGEAAAQLDGDRVQGEGRAIALDDVVLTLPEGRTLLGPTTVELAPGDNVLVVGPSGSGKTTLFRALAGIWPYWKGRIVVPKESRLLFLPQKAYFPIGALRHTVTYPLPGTGVRDDEVRSALSDVGLAHLAADLTREDDWGRVLSGGEQQRLGFARALINKPDWLFLDEATASLPEDAQAQLYALMRARLPKTTLVSIAHRAELAQFHSRRLSWESAEGASRLATI